MSNEQYKEDNSLIEKIKRFFKKLFKKQDYTTMLEEQNEKKPELKEIEKNQAKEDFENSLKVEIKNDFVNDEKREKFIDRLEKNPELFYELPIEKLEKLEDYYKKSIKEYEEKLERIKKAS